MRLAAFSSCVDMLCHHILGAIATSYFFFFFCQRESLYKTLFPPYPLPPKRCKIMSAATANSVHIYCRLCLTNLFSDALGPSVMEKTFYTFSNAEKKSWKQKWWMLGPKAVRDQSRSVIDVQISMLHERQLAIIQNYAFISPEAQ